MFRRLFSRHRFSRDNAGVALLEFAFMLPILLIVFVGTTEFARLAIIHIKLDKAATAMADFLTQSEKVCRRDLDAFATAIPQIVKPFGFTGTVIFSSIEFATASPPPPCTGTTGACITWQYKPLGGDVSKIGDSGKDALLPGGYSVSPGHNLIVAEVYMDYSPMLGAAAGRIITAIQAQKLYKVAVYKPRQFTLTDLCNP